MPEEFASCPRCGYPHPNCKCDMEMPNTPTAESVLAFADGGEVPQVQPISAVDIVSQIPEMEGSYSRAAQALNRPIDENILGNPMDNGEHVLAHHGLQKILDGDLNDKIGRAADKAENPALAGIAGLGHIEKAVTKHQNSIGSEVKNLFDGKDSKNAEEELLSEDEHKELTEKVHTLANNPELLIDKLSEATQGINAVAPQTASSLQQAAVRAIQFLSSKAAQPITGPLEEALKPSDSDISSFSRYVKAIESPKTTFQQIKNGTIGPETVDAISTVYPRLYEKMKQSVLENLTPETPFQLKMAASQFLKAPMDSVLTPQRIQALQQSFVANTDQVAPVSKKAKNTEAIDLASRTSLAPKDEE